MSDIFPGAKLVQLVEWGYPMGSLRPVPPKDKAYSVVHITGNSRLPTAENEVAWRKNDPALQNSATFFVNRNGSVVQALGDPLRMDPWANGAVRSPDLSNPRIAAMVRDGVNANQRTMVAIENVGYEPGYSITPAQEATDAKIIAYYHAKAGVPVTRQTVIGHYQIDSQQRPNCPGVNKSLIDRIVALAGGVPSHTEDDQMDAQPATFHRKSGTLSIRGGTEYNAFRYLGKNDLGQPNLLRLNGLTYPSNTAAAVVGLAHWDANQPESACFMVTPYLYVPNKGVQTLVWWSKTPLNPPEVTWEAVDCGPAVEQAVNEATAKLKQRAVQAVQAL